MFDLQGDKGEWGEGGETGLKRGLIDRLTNRDIVSEQKKHIEFLMREMRGKDELIGVQAEAIEEFRGQVTKLSGEISELWDSVNSAAKKRGEKREKKDESENSESR